MLLRFEKGETLVNFGGDIGSIIGVVLGDEDDFGWNGVDVVGLLISLTKKNQ